MINDPLPDLDLPESVGIPQQPVAGEHEKEIRPHPGAKRQESPREALRAGGIRDGDRHGLFA